MPITNSELDEYDLGKNLPNIGANTIDHPGNDNNPHDNSESFPA